MADGIPLISQPVQNNIVHHGTQSARSSASVRIHNFPPHELLMPSLIQSRTNLTRAASSEQSEVASVISTGTVDTVDSITTGYTTNEETSSSTSNDSNDDDDGNMSDSSEWDKSTVVSGVSLASTYLPRARKKTNRAHDIKSYLIEFAGNEKIHYESKTSGDTPRQQHNNNNNNNNNDQDLTYDLYSLFYPFTNLQSLLFSQEHPYIESDYKKIKKKSPFGIYDEDEEDKEEEKQHTLTDTKMDWNDESSVNRIRELITKLLSSSNKSHGIKEEDLFLMFSSPNPCEIIQQLRFGGFNSLCDVHIDRFGRRSYHYKRSGHERNRSQIHFYNHSNVPSSIFGDGDIVGLSDFIEEDASSVISDGDKSVTSIAKIHYHDNDVVMTTTSPKSSNGKMEVQMQWQNYAIHSYLYRRTRFTHRTPSTNSINSVSSNNTSNNNKNNNNKGGTHVSNARHVAQYGHSITPRMFGSKKKNIPSITPHVISDRVSYNSSIPPLPNLPQTVQSQSYNPHSLRNKHINNRTGNVSTVRDRKHARGISPWIQDIQKEGFLEKKDGRSMTNIINNQWTKYWVILWNTDILLYKKRRNPNIGKLDQPIEGISLDVITLPIPTRFDATNGFYEFRLNTISGNEFYVFRTKNEFQRGSWVQNIETKLVDDTNFKDNKLGPMFNEFNSAHLKNDKTASCLIM